MFNNIWAQNVGKVLYFQKWIHEESLTEMMAKRLKKLRQICFAAKVKKSHYGIKSGFFALKKCKTFGKELSSLVNTSDSFKWLLVLKLKILMY